MELESYIQYASGYQKDDITIDDIKDAILNIQKMDDEHGAFWASVITDVEHVIETDKDLQLFFIFEKEEEKVIKYKASDWSEVLDFYKLLLNCKFDEIEAKMI